MISELESLVKNELRPEEELLWHGQPDADKSIGTILPFSLIWLSGLFLFCVGVLMESGTRQSVILPGLIGVLVLVAFIGVLEIIFVPLKARQTAYAITNQRTFILTIRSRFVHKDAPRTDLLGKQMVKLQENTKRQFIISNLPAQLIFIFLVIDVFISLLRQFEIFIALGFVFVVLGWFMHWHQDLRFPSPRLRDPARTFYHVADLLVSVDSMDHKDVSEVIPHLNRKGNGDLFLLSEDKGCLRLKTVSDGNSLRKLITERLAGSAG
ncbi:MAG TPA: hypothetical protein V6D17_14375 [Candidatus Obscuribacterales bacterium]